MGRYRKKPVVIEAFQFKPVWRAVGACADDAPIWFLQAENDGKVKVWGDDETPYCMIETLEGRMKAEAGDWIIRGVKGEIYPCKPDIFAATYDAVDVVLPRPTIAELEAILNEPTGAVNINPDGSVTVLGN